MQNTTTRPIFRYESSSDDDWGDEEEWALLQPPPMSEIDLEADVNLCTTIRNNDLGTSNQNYEHKTRSPKKSRKKMIPINITDVFKNIHVISRTNGQTVIKNYESGVGTSHSRVMDVSNFKRNETYRSNTTENCDTQVTKTNRSSDSYSLGDIQFQNPKFINLDNVIQVPDSANSSNTGASPPFVHENSTSVINPVKTFANVTKTGDMSKIRLDKSKTTEGCNAMTPVLNQATCNELLKLFESPLTSMDDPSEYVLSPTKIKKARKKSKLVNSIQNTTQLSNKSELVNLPSTSKLVQNPMTNRLRAKFKSASKNETKIKTTEGCNAMTPVLNQATSNELLKLFESPLTSMEDPSEYVLSPTKIKKARKKSKLVNSFQNKTQLSNKSELVNLPSTSKLEQNPMTNRLHAKSKSASKNETKINLKLPGEIVINKKLTKQSVYAEANLFECLLDSNSEPENDQQDNINDDKITDLGISEKYNGVDQKKQLIKDNKNGVKSKSSMKDTKNKNDRVSKKQKKLIKTTRNDQEHILLKNINVSEELNDCKVGKNQRRLIATEYLGYESQDKHCNNKLQQRNNISTVTNGIVIEQTVLLNFHAKNEMEPNNKYIIPITCESMKQFVNTLDDQMLDVGLLSVTAAFMSEGEKLYKLSCDYISLLSETPQKKQSKFRKTRSRRISCRPDETDPNLENLIKMNMYLHFMQTLNNDVGIAPQSRIDEEIRALMNQTINDVFKSIHEKSRLDGYLWIRDETLQDELQLMSNCEKPRALVESNARPFAEDLTWFYHTDDYLPEEITKPHEEELELNRRVLFGFYRRIKVLLSDLVQKSTRRIIDLIRLM